MGNNTVTNSVGASFYAQMMNTVKDTSPKTKNRVNSSEKLPNLQTLKQTRITTISRDNTIVTPEMKKGNIPATDGSLGYLFETNDTDSIPNSDANPNKDFDMEEMQKNFPRSANKAMDHLNLKGGIKLFTLIPSQIIARTVKKEVVSEVTKAIAKVAVEKGGVKASEVLVKTATEGGIAIAKTGGIVGRVKAVSPAIQAVKTLFKGSSKEIVKGSLKAGGEKVLQTATTAGIKNASKKFAEVAIKEGSEKLILEATTKGVANATAKGSVKTAAKASRLVPVIGAVVGAGITIYDGIDAYKKTIDPNVSNVSKILAWTTVGLDVVSTVATATGVGAPIGWAATGLSIASSIGSDLLKDGSKYW